MSIPPPKMSDEEFINDFCDRLQKLVDNSPLAGLCAAGKDGGDNLRALAEALLGKMNVVSRAEFDAQNEILAQTAAKLAEVEEKLAEMEAAKKASEKDNT